MTWEFVFSTPDPVELGERLFYFALDEIRPGEQRESPPLLGEECARWLLTKVFELDQYQWARAAEGVLAHCKSVRLEGWDKADEMLKPFAFAYRKRRDEELLYNDGDDCGPPRDETDFDCDEDESNPL